MGAQASFLYNRSRRLALSYNAERRAEKYLSREKLNPSPRHPLRNDIAKEIALSEEQLIELHGKNERLNEYLKKVYLTSTSTVIGTPSTKPRPKPKKENEILKVFMFYEPETPAPGRVTLSNIVQILLNFHEDSDAWSANAIALKYKLNKRDVVQLLMYYSLYRKEKFQFLNAKEMEEAEEEEELPKVEFEVFNKLEKKPLRQIEAKK